MNSNSKSLCWISVCSQAFTSKRLISQVNVSLDSWAVERELHPFSMHRSRVCLCRDSSSRAGVGMLLFSQWALLLWSPVSCCRMSVKWWMGNMIVSCHSWARVRWLLELGTLSLAQLGFLSNPFYSLGGVGLVVVVVTHNNGVCDPSAQAVDLLCSCNVLQGVKTVMPNLWEEFLGLTLLPCSASFPPPVSEALPAARPSL